MAALRNMQVEAEDGKRQFRKLDVQPRPALGNLINRTRELKTEKSHGVTNPHPMLKEPAQIVASPEAMDMAEAFSDLSIDDIDKYDFDNPQLCAEYVKDIYKYMKDQETLYQVDPKYMKKQPEITEKMRAILVDWLMQVHLRFGLLSETLYLTVTLIDRYLSVCTVKKCDLQLVGVTAMLIASKYEEMYAPEVRDFVYITDNTYPSERIRKTEIHMLKILKYMFGNPLCLHFLRRYSKAEEVTPEMHTFAKFLMELSLVDLEMLAYPPSLIGASALHLAMQLFGETSWSAKLKHYSTYNAGDLTPCIQRMAQLVTKMDTSKQQAVKNKYSSRKFFKVSASTSLKGHVIKTLAAGNSSD